jgi:hypothetical protein
MRSAEQLVDLVYPGSRVQKLDWVHVRKIRLVLYVHASDVIGSLGTVKSWTHTPEARSPSRLGASRTTFR